ncbi:MAG: YdcF family protein [Opitutus sp.]
MSYSLSPAAATAARLIFAYLSETDQVPEPVADAVIGFGTFDVTLASYCGDLILRRRARHLVFTGGIGAGTTDLGMPEADAWKLQLARTHPSIDELRVITENASTNTAENIRFTAALLARAHPELAFGRGLTSALIVASPSRLRRVKLTMQKLEPSVRVSRCLPGATFESEQALYEAKGINYLDHLRGELDRIEAYPERGWISTEPLPPDLVDARLILRLNV